MKKLYSVIAVILVFTFVMPLVSCNVQDERTNLQKISDAMAKLDTLNSIDSSVALKLHIESESSKTTFPITVGIKLNETEKKSAFSFNIPLILNAAAYVSEEKIYVDALNLKLALDPAEILSLIETFIPGFSPETSPEDVPDSIPSSVPGSNLELSLDAVEGYAAFIAYLEGTVNSAIASEKDGVTTINATYHSDDIISKLLVLLKGMVKNSELLSIIETELDDPEMINDVKEYIENISAEEISAVVPKFDIELGFKINGEGYLVEMTAAFALLKDSLPETAPAVFDGEEGDQSAMNGVLSFLASLAKIEVSFTVNNPGTPVLITPPENTSEYTDVTPEEIIDLIKDFGNIMM